MKSVWNKLALLMCFLVIGATYGTSVAAILDPSQSNDYAIGWYDGLGEVDEIYSLPGYGLEPGTFWELTAITDTIHIEAFDGWVSGDEFELFASNDGSTWNSVAWDFEGYVDDYFHGSVDFGGLTRGDTYYFSVHVNRLALWEDGTPRDEGFGYASFEAVPEPATVMLFAFGIVGLIAIRSYGKKTT